MAELRYIQRAHMSPTQCALCCSFEGPFIDTGAEFLGYGHVFICASNSNRSGCVRQMARLDGMMDQEVVGEALRQVDELTERVRELEAQLVEERVVPMSEVLDHLQATQAAQVPAGKED